MKRRARIAGILALASAALAVAVLLAAFLTVRSQWFEERVRERIVSEVERATGGRAALGSFAFDWRGLRAEVRDFVLRGTEGPDRPPLFRARSVSVGLKVVSALKKDVDIAWIRVAQPQVYLIVYPGGRTNVPAPKIRRRGRPVMETILRLAVGRFHLDDGIFEIERQGRTPFQASGANLAARLGYDASAPRYQGEIAMRPLEFRWGARRPVPVDVRFSAAVEAGRIEVAGGRLRTWNSEVNFSGAIDDIPRFRAAFDYAARLDLADLKGIAEVNSPPSGEAFVRGKATFDGFARYHVGGRLNAARVAWNLSFARLRGFRGEGAVSLTPEGLEARDLRLSGGAVLGRKPEAQPVEGRIARVMVGRRHLRAGGVRLAALGGAFAGQAELRDLHAYLVTGEVSGFAARRLLALYSTQQAPWDAGVSGPVRVEGSLRARDSVVASVRAVVAPAPGSPPVSGAVEAAYSARGGTVDFGRSWLQLPRTRVDFSGVLGSRLAVRVESRDLDDILPALEVKSLPVRLEGGVARFDGVVTGPLEDPRISGDASAARVAVRGALLDAFEARVAASKSGIELQDARAAHGTLRAQFEGAARLDGWKPSDALLVWGKGSLREASVADILAVAGRPDIPATGVLAADAELTGRWGEPLLAVDASVAKGTLFEEPFDRLAARVNYRPGSLEASAGRIEAGRKTITWRARYGHAAGDPANGRLRFEAASNTMALEEILTVSRARPDLAGKLSFAVNGEAELRTSGGGAPAFRFADLSGSAVAEDVAVEGRRLGNAKVTAATEGGMLTARAVSDLAGSVIHASGEWRMEGDYPGKARIAFEKLDFLRLRELFAAPGATAARVAGSMAGEITVGGPMLRPEAWRAAAKAPHLEISVTPQTEPANGRANLALRNAGPVTATMADGVVKIEQARFVGRATDVMVGGAINLRQKRNGLDLKVKGQIDLAVLQDLDRDVESSGTVVADAAVRGAPDDPQVTGRMEIKNGAFSLATFPQGIYNAQGVLAFTGTRATIKELTAESGGGQVRLAGFAGYEGDTLLFRLFLRAEQVRVRYPEGVSTVANAALNWSGTSERSTLAGTVSIVRTGFNPQSDFSSILARHAEPVRTPAARTGILGGTHFDVQIETAPDITFESSLAQDVQAEANLRLRGTGANPGMLGRIVITQGRLAFFGTRYNINQGSISFFNASRIEPILNVDLETKARGVDVTLTVSGPINKLNLTPRSDPPLQFNEIVALLATGRAPTSDPALLTQQTTSPQSWQQMGASALLGQAIANPVAGRLQRFFGVTRLKIDPSLTGVENNPQARLTLEQQITPNITFTYITNITNSNPLVVQVEWAVSRTWSVFAVREENGLFGLDFLLKKRF